jgi:hypothetical protein
LLFESERYISKKFGGRRCAVRGRKERRLEDEKLRRCGPSAFGGLRLEAGKDGRLEDEKI